MNKFKALLRKDYLVYRNTLFAPLWIVAGLYLLIIIALGIGLIKGSINLQFLPFDIDEDPLPAVNFLLNMMTVGLPSLLVLIFTVSIAQSALNEDLRKNCELFHRSQPVSFWLRTFSKFTLSIGGNWLILLIIGIFNFIIMNSILAYFRQFLLGAGLLGMLIAFIHFMKIILLIGSFSFLLSSVFKDNAFFKGMGFLLGIEVLFSVVNLLLGLHLPLPLKYLISLFSIESQINLDNPFMLDYNYLVKEIWRMTLWNWKSLIQVAVSCCFFVLASLIYNNREVK